MRNNLVSVIIPVYNAEKYIKDAIESVLNQTYPNFEIIIVDDASTDKTVDIINSFNDKRIRFIRHTKNQGPGAARNTALEVAKGKWIAILDADDQWLPNRLEKMVNSAIEAGDSYFLADDLLLCFDTPQGLRPWKKQFEEYQIKFNDESLDLTLLEFMKKRAPVIKPIIPMEHIKKYSLKFEPKCLCGEDLEFWAHLFRTGLKLRLIPEALYLYRITPGSLTSKQSRHEHLIRVYRRLLSYEDFSNEERMIFQKQIERRKKEEKWGTFAFKLKKKDIIGSLIVLLQNPELFVELFKRLPKSLDYRISALRLKGKVR